MEMEMNGKVLLATMVALVAFGAFAAPHGGAGRENFVLEQAYAEMQRVGGQVDALETNQSRLSERVARLEGGKGEAASLRSDVDAMKAEISGLRRELQTTRDAVNDLIKRINNMNARTAAGQSRPASRPSNPPPSNLMEYTVASGDSLYLIATAFNTTVAKLKEWNSLKSNQLRVGQKLLVPQPDKN